MNDAAARAIRYTETPHRKVLVDYNYAELQQVEKTNARLQLQRFRKKEIEEQKIKIRELGTVAWHCGHRVQPSTL